MTIEKVVEEIEYDEQGRVKKRTTTTTKSYDYGRPLQPYPNNQPYVTWTDSIPGGSRWV